jgi:ATP-dependent DNA helicase RecQ
VALPLTKIGELAGLVRAGEGAGGLTASDRGRADGLVQALRDAYGGLGPEARADLTPAARSLIARLGRVPERTDAPPAPPPGLPRALEALGVRELRPGQDRAITAALAGRDALVVMATGSGKSLCYQAPALASGGLCLVVSPLIALMSDQGARLAAAGLPAAVLTSAISEEEHRRAMASVRSGACRILYVAPERLGSAPLREALAARGLDLLAVDEAHCVSEWGHDFRPDYRRVDEARRALAPRATMALTATATPAVQRDIVRRLGLRDPLHVVTGFDRPNLTFDAVEVAGRGSTARARAVLREVLAASGEGKAIVYCGTRAASDEVADELRAAGHAAVSYHAGRADRTEVQDAFTSGRARVIAATNAFGMGVDVPDVRLVVHLGVPDSLEQLAQEAGRGGRDGEPARHVAILRPGDVPAIGRRIERARIGPEEVERRMRLLWASGDGAGSFHVARERLGDDDRIALAMAERAGALRLEPAPGGATAGRVRAPRLSAEEREALAGEVGAELNRRYRARDALIDYVRGDGCRRLRLLRHFGDGADPAPEGRCCDRCEAPPDLRVALEAEPAAPRAARRSGGGAGESPGPPAGDLGPDERRLYEALRAWRGELAKELGWPAFRVASNRTLIGIAQSRPGDGRALEEVRGVGPWLMEGHAADLLALVAADAAPAGA